LRREHGAGSGPGANEAGRPCSRKPQSACEARAAACWSGGARDKAKASAGRFGCDSGAIRRTPRKAGTGSRARRECTCGRKEAGRLPASLPFASSCRACLDVVVAAVRLFKKIGVLAIVLLCSHKKNPWWRCAFQENRVGTDLTPTVLGIGIARTRTPALQAGQKRGPSLLFAVVDPVSGPGSGPRT
jgi:hypothetical protein